MELDTQQSPKTEGIKFAGSKLRMLPHILRLARRTGASSVFDGFSGTTRVAQAFARSGFRVITNDSSEWSRVFGICYLKGGDDLDRYRDLIGHLNSLPGREGWFTENYGGVAGDRYSAGPDGVKKPFQVHNTKRLDSIREEIDDLRLPEPDRSVALTSLILALDKVDSTMGHFASYLREWSARSYGNLELEVPKLSVREGRHEILKGDIFEKLGEADTELSYFDPPYGSNNAKMPPSRVRYAAYYHFWTTVVLNDRPRTFGKANRRMDSTDTLSYSAFEDFRRDDDGSFVAVEAIRDLIRRTRSRFSILSYSSGGRATREALVEVLRSEGRIVESVEVGHRRNVMSSMRWTGEWTRKKPAPHKEYLFLLEK